MDSDAEESLDTLAEEVSLTEDMGEDREDLAGQIFQLQELVYEMKDGFTKAMQALSGIQGDDKSVLTGSRDDAKLNEVVDMVVSLKEDFGTFSVQLKEALNNQNRLEKKIQILQCEKDLLLEELERHGSISHHSREKFISSSKLSANESSSTLTALLERAQNGFHENSFKDLSQNNSHTSDQDSGVNTCRQGDMSSCGEVTPPSGSPMVQSYINSLQDPTDPAEEDGYDSDSSLTAAANKSLDISRSLGDECAKMTQIDSSDDEEESNRQQDISKSSNSSNQQSQKERVENTSSIVDRKLAPHERNTKDMLRSRVSREILDTERKYCNSLWTVLDHFAAPLKQAGIVNSKDIAIMFPGCLYTIYEHHCKFLQRLEERLCNWRWQGVLGDVLSRFFDPVNCDLLKQYKTYVKEFPASLHQLKKACRHSMRFRKFIKRSQSHPCCEGLDLASFLLTPIQRVPRYVLLFKQLLKHTEQEHPDYYHIEMSLQRLGAFLSDLNNSIEDSMNVVRSDTTPKPKKKLRMGSFRSSSVSSYEGQHLSTSTRDSGVQSGVDNASLKSSSSGRIFQLAVFKEGEQDSAASGAPESLSYQSESIAEYESLTLPTKKAKKLRGRERRYKTDEIQHASLQGVTAPLPPGNRHNMSLPEGVGGTSNGRRPMSATGNLSVDYSAQRRLTTPSPSGRPPSTAFSDGSESLSGYMTRSLHSPAPLPPVGGTPRYVSSMFSASASMRNLPEEFYNKPAMNKSSLHYSMPGIFNPNDLGIYGDDDDEVEHSSYQPSLDGSVTANPPKLGAENRSKSIGELLPKSPAQPGSPTQQQIVQSLARSLGGAPPRPLSPRDMNSSVTLLSKSGPELQGRPKSSLDLPNEPNRVSQKPPRPRSAAIPSPIPHEKPRDSIWDESTLDGSSINMTMDTTMNGSTMNGSTMNGSTMNGSIMNGSTMNGSTMNGSTMNGSTMNGSTMNGSMNALKKRFQLKRWVHGKDKDRRYHPAAEAAANATNDGETSTLSVKDKKKGFKSSIKDIFKKRKSDVSTTDLHDHTDVVNTSTCSAEYEADLVLESGPIGTRVMELDHSDIKSEDDDSCLSSLQQDADTSVVLVSIKSQEPEVTLPELVTFEDENGDPCSAV